SRPGATTAPSTPSARRSRSTPSPATRTSTSPSRSTSARRSSSPRKARDRKSTRLNSSHVKISYAVFCSKKKIIQTSELPKVPAFSPSSTHWPMLIVVSNAPATTDICPLSLHDALPIFEAGRYDGAVDAFRKAVALNPFSRDAHFNLAQSLYQRAQELQPEEGA